MNAILSHRPPVELIGYTRNYASRHEDGRGRPLSAKAARARHERGERYTVVLGTAGTPALYLDVAESSDAYVGVNRLGEDREEDLVLQFHSVDGAEPTAIFLGAVNRRSRDSFRFTPDGLVARRQSVGAAGTRLTHARLDLAHHWARFPDFGDYEALTRLPRNPHGDWWERADEVRFVDVQGWFLAVLDGVGLPERYAQLCERFPVREGGAAGGVGAARRTLEALGIDSAGDRRDGSVSARAAAGGGELTLTFVPRGSRGDVMLSYRQEDVAVGGDLANVVNDVRALVRGEEVPRWFPRPHVTSADEMDEVIRFGAALLREVAGKVEAGPPAPRV